MNKEEKEKLAIKFLDEIGNNTEDMMEIAEIMKQKAYKRKVYNLT